MYRAMVHKGESRVRCLCDVPVDEESPLADCLRYVSGTYQKINPSIYAHNIRIAVTNQ